MSVAVDVSAALARWIAVTRFDLSDAAPGQPGGTRDAHPGIAQTDDPAVMRQIGLRPSVPPCPRGKLDSLTLPLPPGS